MDDLKNLLFEETLVARKRYVKCREEYGEYEFLTNTAFSRFTALYMLIEDAGLEDEYQAWKATQKQKEVST